PGPGRRRLARWFRRHHRRPPAIAATGGGPDAMVSLVALGCGVALLPAVVLENRAAPVRKRVMILERSGEHPPVELGGGA
ncbi:LysR substrate-binding domain-containing protein, partial [Klebsiella pneumoniae]|uniref:LysR substrate-binding domain-containing protein n=1 Tax=Klebsiella pneumoniae TaxID=573 RepID=UPI00272FA491